MKGYLRFVPYIILTIVVCALYLPTLPYGLVSDDIGTLLTAASSWQSPMAAVTRTVVRGHVVLWYYLYQLFGPTPWPYRLVNIMSHIGSVLLVFAIVRRLANRRIGFVSALLFAVHPVAVESVTWIAGGIYTQYCFLFLLSFFFYLKSGEEKERTLMFLFLAAGTFLASLLFSEKAGVLAFPFPWYAWCFGNGKKEWRKWIAFVILGSLSIVLYGVSQLGGRVSEVGRLGGGEMYNPLIQIPWAVSSYIQLTVWPKDLTLYHPDPVVTPEEYMVRLGLFLVFAAGGILVWVKNRRIAFWFVWVLIPLIPVLLPYRIAWFIAERYAYVSLIGMVVLIAYGFEWVSRAPLFVVKIIDKSRLMRFFSARFCSQKKIKNFSATPRALFFTAHSTWPYWILIGGIVVVLSVRTATRNRDWQNEDTLWVATARVSPTVPYTWNNMGDVYSRRGDLVNAVASFQRAIALNPQYADAYHNLGETYRTMGETGDAVLMYEKALSIDPMLWQSYRSMVAVYVNNKEYQKGLFYIEQALKIVPQNQDLLLIRNKLRELAR